MLKEDQKTIQEYQELKQDYIKNCLHYPNDFCYYGDNEEMFKTYGYAWDVQQNRDSDAFVRSNFECITKELLGLFPEDCYIESHNHWAHGHLDVLAVNTTNDNLIDKIFEIREKLADYPIYNEDHFSELEYDDFTEYVEDSFICEILNWIEDNNILYDIEQNTSKLRELIYRSCNEFSTDSLYGNESGFNSDIINAIVEEYGYKDRDFYKGIHKDKTIQVLAENLQDAKQFIREKFYTLKISNFNTFGVERITYNVEPF